MTYAPLETDPRSGMPAAEGEDAAPRRRGVGCAFEIVETLVLTIVIYLVIHNFVAQPFKVEQSSMIPTLLPDEYVLIDKLTPRFSDYQRGDIVVFTPPSGFEQGGVPFIKRVIGIPGDTVSLENGRVFVAPAGGEPRQLSEPYINTVDGEFVATRPRDAQGTSEWHVGAGTYFVMGDNRDASQDSRTFGPISRDLIVGRGWLRYFPLDRIGVLERPRYGELDGDAAAGPASDLSLVPAAGVP
ncbi:MAG: signal peptidase I [Chloroflexota bacterium]|nr:signal peptidase I [Chloroflexota bacterium]